MVRIQTKAKWPSFAEWEGRRELISDLYEQKSLKEVMQIMERDHDFKGTTKMYKSRIKQWGLGKHHTDKEMRTMIVKAYTRAKDDKASTFYVRGKETPYSEAARYWRRRGISLNEVLADRATSSTPTTLRCVTPPLSSPRGIAIPEQLLHRTNTYITGSFSSGTWSSTSELSICHNTQTKAHSTAARTLSVLYDQTLAASTLFEKQRYQEAGQAIVSATGSIKDIILAEDPRTLNEISCTLIEVLRRGLHEVALAVVRQFSSLARLVLNPFHPLAQIYALLASIPPSEFVPVLGALLARVRDNFSQELGPCHRSTLEVRQSCVRYTRHFRGLDAEGPELVEIVRQYERRLGEGDIRTINIRLSLAYHLLGAEKLEESKALGEVIVEHTRITIEEPDAFMVHTRALYLLAEVLFRSGEFETSIGYLLHAIELRIERFGLENCLAQHWMVLAEERLEKAGMVEDAARVRTQWRRQLTMVQ